MARAQLRRSYVALYGQKNPVAGLEMATQAATTSRTASNVLAGLAMLHVAEAHAMRQHAQSCEDALSAADTHFGKIGEADEAAPLFAPTDLSRMAGSCYLYLDDAPRTAHFLTETLRRGGGQTKAAAVAAANLALAHARQGKIDEAVGACTRPSTSWKLPEVAAASRSRSARVVRSAGGETVPPCRMSTTACSP